MPIYCVDALVGLKQLKSESINLVVSSPPYADIRKSYSYVDPNQYVSWFTPIAKELFRALTSTGSFILNINDKCIDGERHTYVFELVLKLKELGFHFIDRMVWVKKNGVSGNGKRRSDYFEFIFHFAKSSEYVFNVDAIRTPYAPSSIKRAQSPIKANTSNRETRELTATQYKEWKLNPLGALPKNVLYFKKDSGDTIHKAAFHIELPTHFIKAHSNPGDTVLDPFAGKGTTLIAAKLLNRQYIGLELKQEYVDLAKSLYNLD